MKNKLIDLNNILFAQLERISDEDLEDDGLIQEINRSKAITSLASQVVANARLAFDAHCAINEGLIKSAPKMLGVEGCGTTEQMPD